MRRGAGSLGIGVALIVVLAVLGGCATGSTPAGSTASHGPTALADTGLALYGIGIACGGATAAAPTCAAEAVGPAVLRAAVAIGETKEVEVIHRRTRTRPGAIVTTALARD